MDEIIKFLKSMGLGDQEIQKVLKEVPVEQTGLMGTNVATGVFTKTNPKSKEFVKDFPLVVERIGNPFEVNYYKGKSREETIRMAEDNVKFLENEIKKLADQLLNKNLQLSEQQRINLAKNLATKRKIEKDLEDFKTRPEAPVVDIKTGETVADVERLKEKSGLTAPPTTDIGRIDLRNKQMLQKAEEFYKSQDEFQKEEIARQALIAKQYEGKGYAGGVFGPSGMYRAVARSFLLDQNAKGKIKLTDDVINNLKDRNYISGGQPLLYPDPIRIMRLHYGDDVFEKIPLDKIKTGAESEIIGEMSKININPIKVEAPATPGGYMTPGEIKANIEELENIEKMIKRREFRFADMTDQEIKNELEHYGSQKNAFEVAFGYDHPKEYKEYLKSIERKDPKKIISLEDPSKTYKPFGSDFTKQEKVDWLIKNVDPEAKVTIPSPEFLQNMLDSGREDLIDHFWEIHTSNIGRKPVIDIDTSNLKNPALVRAMMEKEASKPKLVYSKEKAVEDSVDDAGKVNKDDPEKFAKGGSVESLGLDYLTGVERNYLGRSNFEKGSIPKMLQFFIDKLVDEKNFNRKLLEKTNPKLIKEMYIEKFGKLPSAEEIKEIVNKQLQGKYSMESINKKTGEVTTPKEPVTIADKKRQLTKEEIEDYEELLGDSETWMSEGTVEEAEKALKRSKAEEAYYRGQYLTGKLDPVAGEKSQSRMRFLRKKAEEAELTGDRRLITPDEFDELEELENIFKTATDSEGKSIPGAFSFNDPEMKAGMEKAMAEAKRRGDEMRAMGLDPASGRDYDRYIEIKTKSGDKDFNKYFDDLEIKTKFKGVISDDLLEQILMDDNPQRKAEVVAAIEQGLKMQEKGMSPEEIVNILKNAPRTKQAYGGRIGFEKGSIPEEENEEPSEEYIKSREAGRFKYSFDVQGPDSKIKKSGLPGRTNPKDYSLGITYLSNPSSETAPEIRVGGSRRGAGIEIRKKFKEGGLGYLVGE